MCTLMEKCSCGRDEARAGGVGSEVLVSLAAELPASRGAGAPGTQYPVPGDWAERPLACVLLPAWGRVG